jgi:hypothetical protein
MSGEVRFGRAECESLERPIRASAQLLVEGRTPEIFFQEFVRALKLEGQVDVRTFGDISRQSLSTWLELFSRKAAFRQSVRRIAFIRDAEAGPASEAYESVCGVVRSVLPVTPAPMGEFNGDPLSVGIFILPDCSRSGMLESLCLEAWADEEPVAGCTRAFGSCLGVGESFKTTKQRLAAHLVARNVVDPQLGRAAQQGVIPWDHSTFAPLTSFLRDLGATGQGGAS